MTLFQELQMSNPQASVFKRNANKEKLNRRANVASRKEDVNTQKCCGALCASVGNWSDCVATGRDILRDAQRI